MAAGDRAKLQAEARSLSREADKTHVIADAHELRAKSLSRQIEKLDAEIKAAEPVPDTGWINHYRDEHLLQLKKVEKLRAEVEERKQTIESREELMTTFPRVGDDEAGRAFLAHQKTLYEEESARLRRAEDELDSRRETVERAQKQHDDYEDMRSMRADLVTERDKELATAKTLDALADSQDTTANAIDEWSKHADASSDVVPIDLLEGLDQSAGDGPGLELESTEPEVVDSSETTFTPIVDDPAPDTYVVDELPAAAEEASLPAEAEEHEELDVVDG